MTPWLGDMFTSLAQTRAFLHQPPDKRHDHQHYPTLHPGVQSYQWRCIWTRPDWIRSWSKVIIFLCKIFWLISKNDFQLSSIESDICSRNFFDLRNWCPPCSDQLVSSFWGSHGLYASIHYSSSISLSSVSAQWGHIRWWKHKLLFHNTPLFSILQCQSLVNNSNVRKIQIVLKIFFNNILGLMTRRLKRAYYQAGFLKSLK